MLFLLTALVAAARGQANPAPDDRDWDHVYRCQGTWSSCSLLDDQRVDAFDFEVWSYRNEAIHAIRSTKDKETNPTRVQRLCEKKHPTVLACTALFLDTGDRRWATRACELGDPSACLLDTLDQLATDRQAALDDLGAQCRAGAAMACAWRLEELRGGLEYGQPRPDGFDEAFDYAQRACLHLHEGTACAATAKAMKQLGWVSRAHRFYAHACDQRYQPACGGSLEQPLADEAPPSLLAAPIFDAILFRKLIPGRFPPHGSLWFGWGI